MKRASTIFSLLLVLIVVLSACGNNSVFLDDLEPYDSSSSEEESFVDESFVREENLPSPEVEPPAPIVSREYRGNDMLITGPLRIAHVDFSLPPEQRNVEHRVYQTPDDGLSFNELLWLMRGEENYSEMPIMGEISKCTETRGPNIYYINITDDSFRGNENFFNDLINTAFSDSQRHPASFFHVIIQQNGVVDSSLSTFGRRNFFSFVDYDRHVPYFYLPNEVMQLQRGIPFVPPTFNTVWPLFSEEEMAELSPQRRAELESLWLGVDEISNNIMRFLQSITTSLVDYQTLSFQFPEQAPYDFVMLCTLIATSSSPTNWEDYEALALIRSYALNDLGSFAPLGGLLGAHAEETARLIFGENVQIVHGGFAGWIHSPHLQYYAHVPMGLGDRLAAAFFRFISATMTSAPDMRSQL